MNETLKDKTHENIRRQIASDIAPVNPLRSEWSAALILLPLGILSLTIVLVSFGLRPDAESVNFWSLWGPAILMLGTAYLLLVMALRQRAPQTTVHASVWLTLPLLAIGIQLGGFWIVDSWTPSTLSRVTSFHEDSRCFRNISLVALPSVLVVIGLLSRGLPLRPKLAGFLGGVGGGLISEAVYRLHCPVSFMGHVAVWHTGAILVAGLLGLLLGLYWERRRMTRWMVSQSGN